MERARGPGAAPGRVTSQVMLRWVLPVDRAHDSPRRLIRARISPAVRAGGWLYGPGTTHHVSDQGRSAWVTVVTPVDDLAAVRDELAERLGAAPRVETSRDALLSPGGGWYRTALQRVTHVGLDVLEARERLPLSEYEAFERPSESALPLLAFLSGASETYRRTCPTYESAEAFWLDFFRRAPAPELPRAGRWLWNLAG